GSYTGESSALLWLLQHYHTIKGQVGYYGFSESPQGMHMVDLRGFGMVALRYYRHGALVEDFTNPTQTKDYLALAQTTMSAVPVSFNEVPSPAQLTQEVASGHALTYALASSLDKTFVETLHWNSQYDSPAAFVSDGPLILSWAVGQSGVFNFAGESFLTRRSVYPTRLLVSAPSGLQEIAIYNGTELFRRILLNGEQEYSQTFVLEDTLQSNLVVIAIDKHGKRAVSFPRRSGKADSLAPSFCSDHVNDCRSYYLMAHGPFQLPATRPPALPADSTGLTWDGGPDGRLYLAAFNSSSPVLTSSLGTEEGLRFNQTSMLDFADEGAVSVKSESTEIFDPSIPTSALNPWRAYGPKHPSFQMDFTLTYQEVQLPALKVMDFGSPLYGHREGINAALF